MQESNIANIHNTKPIFILRGRTYGMLCIGIFLYMFFIFISSILVLAFYPTQPTDSIPSFIFVLILFLGSCYLFIDLILTFCSKIRGYKNGLVITNLFLQKRIIPFSMIRSIVPQFVYWKRYGATAYIECTLQLILTSGESIKFKTFGFDKLPEYVDAITEFVKESI